LVDVPEMEYRSTDEPYARGEICIRGHSLMKEYYKSPEKTAETIDADGWLHTGDIGMLDSANRVVIIDRLKNIFKLSQVKYKSLVNGKG
jgi:long-chain acyl-CoA synthetase